MIRKGDAEKLTSLFCLLIRDELPDALKGELRNGGPRDISGNAAEGTFRGKLIIT